MSNIKVRQADLPDAPAIRDIFKAAYGKDYPYAQFYDVGLLGRMIYSESALVLVAEDLDNQRILGTASVVFEAGAYTDLVGEFGRLVVHPDARGGGVANLLMEARLEHVQERLHVGIIEGRGVHPFTQIIADTHGFALVGFLPLKMLLGQRESLAYLVRHFGPALQLRENHPRVIPEAYPLAHLALENCKLPVDAIVDETAAAYPPGGDFQLEELSTECYTSLLRIERGRLRNREVFGPMRLHYGFFKLQAKHSSYLIAREQGRIVGAIGFTRDDVDRVVRIFELIALDDLVIRPLAAELERRCREDWGLAYIEVDISAYAPRMQRTFLELGFLPVAYVPALAFHEVERLDLVKMVRLLTPLNLGDVKLTPQTQALAELVLKPFHSRAVLPRIAAAVHRLPLFAGLNQEQVNRVVRLCSHETFAAGADLLTEGEVEPRKMFVVLDGEVTIHLDKTDISVATTSAGESLGEMALLTDEAHSATARAKTKVEAAGLTYADVLNLTRQRPDIGLLVYRNLAADVGRKLKRASRTLHDSGEHQVAPES